LALYTGGPQLAPHSVNPNPTKTEKDNNNINDRETEKLRNRLKTKIKYLNTFLKARKNQLDQYIDFLKLILIKYKNLSNITKNILITSFAKALL
jgi:hypothetical protein